MLKRLSVLSLVLLFFASVASGATLHPLRTSPTNSVPLNDANPTLSGGAGAGSGSTQFDLFSKVHRYRLGVSSGRSNPVRITAAEIAIQGVDVSGVTSLSVYMTRPMSVTTGTGNRTYDVKLGGNVVANSGNLASQLTATGAVVKFTFPTAITNAEIGDYPRVRVLAPSIPAIFYRVPISGAYYRGNVAPSDTGYDWENIITPITAYGVPVRLYSDTGVHAVFDGTSIPGGSPGNRSFADFTAALADPYVTIAEHLRTLTDNELTYRVVSVAGSKVADQAARFDSYVLPMLSRYLVADYLPNDIGVTSKSAAFASLTQILDKCIANDIIPILILTPPNSSHDNTWHTTREDWNASVVALKATYPTLVVVPLDDVLGTLMAGGPAGNKRALQPWADAGDGVHMSSLGYSVIAREIARAMGWFPQEGLVFGVNGRSSNVYGVGGLGNINVFGQ